MKMFQGNNRHFMPLIVLSDIAFKDVIYSIAVISKFLSKFA